MKTRVLILLLMAALVGGCSSSSSPTPEAAGGEDGNPVLGVQVVNLNAATGGGVQSTHGHTVTFPPAALSVDTTVTLSVLQQPPMQPACQDFLARGNYLVLHLGNATLTGPITVQFPYQTANPNSTYLQWLLDGKYYLPLTTQYNAATGVLTATLDPTPNELAGLGRSIAPRVDTTQVTLGVGDSLAFDSRPAHQDWPSFNAYHYDSVTEDYRTLAGDAPGLEYGAVDLILGQHFDDGLVDKNSANATDIGSLDAQVVKDNHTKIVDDASNGLPVIEFYLNQAYTLP